MHPLHFGAAVFLFCGLGMGRETRYVSGAELRKILRTASGTVWKVHTTPSTLQTERITFRNADRLELDPSEATELQAALKAEKLRPVSSWAALARRLLRPRRLPLTLIRLVKGATTNAPWIWCRGGDHRDVTQWDLNDAYWCATREGLPEARRCRVGYGRLLPGWDAALMECIVPDDDLPPPYNMGAGRRRNKLVLRSDLERYGILPRRVHLSFRWRLSDRFSERADRLRVFLPEEWARRVQRALWGSWAQQDGVLVCKLEEGQVVDRRMMHNNLFDPLLAHLVVHRVHDRVYDAIRDAEHVVRVYVDSFMARRADPDLGLWRLDKKYRLARIPYAARVQRMDPLAF